VRVANSFNSTHAGFSWTNIQSPELNAIEFLSTECHLRTAYSGDGTVHCVVTGGWTTDYAQWRLLWWRHTQNFAVSASFLCFTPSLDLSTRCIYVKIQRGIWAFSTASAIKQSHCLEHITSYAHLTWVRHRTTMYTLWSTLATTPFLDWTEAKIRIRLNTTWLDINTHHYNHANYYLFK